MAATERSSATAVAYRSAARLARLTPGRLGQSGAKVLGAVAGALMGRRCATAERHQRRVSPELDHQALRARVRQACSSYIRYWFESFRVPHLSSTEVAAGFDIVGFERITAARAAGRGLILALPHLGGWEWAGRWLAEQGVPVTVVVERLDDDALFDWFVGLRAQLGMTVVPAGPEAGAAVTKALKANQAVCLLCDRDLHRGGVEVEFFGERTHLPAGPAMLGLRTGAPVIPAAVYFTDSYNGHQAVVRAPLDTRRSAEGLRADVARITQALAGELEVLIRRAPEQWHLFVPNWPSDPGYER